MVNYLPEITGLTGFALAIFPGGFLVSLMLKPFRGSGSKIEGMEKAGRLIGYLERAIVVVLVFNGAYSAIGFVFTAKSIARFNRLKDREVAEYYLVGTLGSVAWAVVVGEATKFAIDLIASLA